MPPGRRRKVPIEVYDLAREFIAPEPGDSPGGRCDPGAAGAEPMSRRWQVEATEPLARPDGGPSGRTGLLDPLYHRLQDLYPGRVMHKPWSASLTPFSTPSTGSGN